mmetsp:Transcript_7936/g.17058  ORF Transcript_7936/g.17058 Transcript_7936/m.17058 type:complete len:251 (+) Transcript_7936:263-1015(+)
MRAGGCAPRARRSSRRGEGSEIVPRPARRTRPCRRRFSKTIRLCCYSSDLIRTKNTAPVVLRRWCSRGKTNRRTTRLQRPCAGVGVLPETRNRPQHSTVVAAWYWKNCCFSFFHPLSWHSTFSLLLIVNSSISVRTNGIRNRGTSIPSWPCRVVRIAGRAGKGVPPPFGIRPETAWRRPLLHLLACCLRFVLVSVSLLLARRLFVWHSGHADRGLRRGPNLPALLRFGATTFGLVGTRIKQRCYYHYCCY